ncbi:MAG: DUF480 domain-containing protein [Mycobacteriales bacterium]
MDLPVLDAEEQRVLGSLLEKQLTVPDSYPLSLNSLRTACNQSSSREPVVDWDEPTVEAIARRLRQRELVRVVWADKGRRTLKYHQLLTDVVELPDDQRALLTVLLLRGPQAPGELRTRTERLHGFGDRADVEAVLERMAGRGLVAQLARRAGERDHRWTHLLGSEAPAPAPEPDVAPSTDEEVLATLATVAEAYADSHADALTAPSFERWLLSEVAREATGPVIEVGCGPGHVTAFLVDQGADAQGLDFSPAMLDQARARHPGIRFQRGDQRQLMRPDGAPGWSAVVAWFSLVYLPPEELAPTVAALARPLAPGGTLVIGTLTGGGLRRATEWLGHEVAFTLVKHTRESVLEAVRQAGLSDVTWYVRGARPDEGSDRLFVVAR